MVSVGDLIPRELATTSRLPSIGVMIFCSAVAADPP
jgi:hypothetical protein